MGLRPRGTFRARLSGRSATSPKGVGTSWIPTGEGRREEHYGHTGAFEGAAYEAKGLYRSEVDCIMFTRNPTKYCCVCTRAIERIIDLYSK